MIHGKNDFTVHFKTSFGISEVVFRLSSRSSLEQWVTALIKLGGKKWKICWNEFFSTFFFSFVSKIVTSDKSVFEPEEITKQSQIHDPKELETLFSLEIAAIEVIFLFKNKLNLKNQTNTNFFFFF